MPKIKVPRSNPSLDMTPMVDLAFLLVTFFMLTASFRTDEKLPVDVPSSTSDKLLPENTMLVTVDTVGRVFYDIDDQNTRKKLIESMMAKYKVELTEQEIKEFILMKEIGMPMSSLKQYLSADNSERLEMDKSTPGIPYDSLNNELSDWILYGRLADATVAQESGKELDRLKFAIKGDGETNYTKIRKIMKIFQDRKVNTFSLITNLEGK
ncbi:MAG: ExbD/TolR family protein [Flavobacteriales bacterium]